MMSITKTLDTIFVRFSGITKSDRDFLTELFELLLCIRGRVNFTNLARYSHYNEVTFRRHFKKFFDWFKFNYLLIELVLLDTNAPVIAAMDCSYISKSGKHTSGLDRFWSGVANRVKKGLEITLVCLINVQTGQAWSLDVRQTPGGLSAKEGSQQDYTRTDFYVEQLADCIVQLPDVQYYTGDGFYAKTKVIQVLRQHDKHIISKLRCNADLKYLLDRNKNPNAHGNRKYEGKVIWKTLDLNRWIYVGADHKYPHLELYTQILYSPKFKCEIKVVFVKNTKTNKYVLLFTTDITLAARRIVTYYQLRFKIEFIFRDAKQFTGLTHCQARDEDKLDFHFNMSLAALNLYQYEATIAQSNESTFSMNSIIRKAYNTKFLKLFFSKLSSEPNLDEILIQKDIEHPKIQEIIHWGRMNT